MNKFIPFISMCMTWKETFSLWGLSFFFFFFFILHRINQTTKWILNFWDWKLCPHRVNSCHSCNATRFIHWLNSSEWTLEWRQFVIVYFHTPGCSSSAHGMIWRFTIACLITFTPLNVTFRNICNNVFVDCLLQPLHFSDSVLRNWPLGVFL